MFRIFVCCTIACFSANGAFAQDIPKIVTVNPFDGKMIVAPAAPVRAAESPKPKPPKSRRTPARPVNSPVDGSKKHAEPAQPPAPGDPTLAANTPTTPSARPLPAPVLPIAPALPRLQLALVVPRPGWGHRVASADEPFRAQDRFWLQAQAPVDGRLQISVQTPGATPKVIFPFDDLPDDGDYLRASEMRLFPPEDRWSLQFDERPGDVCLIVRLLPAEVQLAAQGPKLLKDAYPKSVQISPVPAFGADADCSFVLKQLPSPPAGVDASFKKAE